MSRFTDRGRRKYVVGLVLPLFIGAVIAGSTAGVAAAGGFKAFTVIPPFPPLLNVPLPAKCQVHVETKTNKNKKVTDLYCHNIDEQNPDPPKDTKSVKVGFGSQASCTFTAYPNGDVTVACRIKGEIA